MSGPERMRREPPRRRPALHTLEGTLFMLTVLGTCVACLLGGAWAGRQVGLWQAEQQQADCR